MPVQYYAEMIKIIDNIPQYYPLDDPDFDATPTEKEVLELGDGVGLFGKTNSGYTSVEMQLPSVTRALRRIASLGIGHETNVQGVNFYFRLRSRSQQQQHPSSRDQSHLLTNM